MLAGRSFVCIVLLLCLLPYRVKADAASDLANVQEAFFDWHQKQSPEYSTYVGHTQFNDILANLSLDVFLPQHNAVQELINTVRTINRGALSRQQNYSYDIFMDTLTTFVSNYDWRLFGALNPVSFLEAFYLDLDYIVNITPFNTPVDFKNYIARLNARPVQINQIVERMRESMRLGTTYHYVSVKTVPDQISSVIKTAPEDSPLYKPFRDTLDSLQITQFEKDDLRSLAQKGLQAIWTALGLLQTFIRDEYSHHTRGSYGVGGLPSGGNYYRACLKWHLSVDTPPAQVHQTGLREVERITQLMHEVMGRQGFTGTVREYYSKLKADPQFQKHSAAQILDDYRNIIFNRIYPKLDRLFQDIPNSTVIVKPLPYDGPYGMYEGGSEDGSRPGTFYVNVFRPNDTHSFSMVSLTLHETVPGHHLQGIYQKAAGLPNFQKHIDYNYYYAIPYHFPFYTAYTEGWALYAEYLGEELGVYDNDFELLGRYGDEIFRACRLVVDTGMHYLGWSREKAVQYMTERTLMPVTEVEIEVNRYLTWPGQACAYKIGELKIKELRQRASDALGPKFNIREFHSLLLNCGPVPLNVMETIVNDYIADRIGSTSTGGQIIG